MLPRRYGYQGQRSSSIDVGPSDAHHCLDFSSAFRRQQEERGAGYQEVLAQQEGTRSQEP